MKRTSAAEIIIQPLCPGPGTAEAWMLSLGGSAPGAVVARGSPLTM